MRIRGMHNYLAVFYVLLAGCASVQETPATAGSCQLDPNELQTIKARALDYLISEWPVLERRCESMSDTIRTSHRRECLIVGGPRVSDPTCGQPSHKGYEIAFRKESLDPMAIYWLTD